MRIVSLLSPAATILTAIIFIYANPYTSDSVSVQTKLLVYLFLIFPAIMVIVSYFIQSNKLKVVSFIVSFPLAIYIGLAKIPGYWNALIIFVLLYLIIPTKRKLK